MISGLIPKREFIHGFLVCLKDHISGGIRMEKLLGTQPKRSVHGFQKNVKKIVQRKGQKGKRNGQKMEEKKKKWEKKKGSVVCAG
jgi:hypothetical protein